MSLQIELLETSFQAIAPYEEIFAANFYERLFTCYPQARTFFASVDMREQRKKLLGALRLVIQNLKKPDILTSTLRSLGQRHGIYGIQPEHYPIVGTILLDTFADHLGEQWTSTYHQAWTEAYENITAIMLEGVQIVSSV